MEECSHNSMDSFQGNGCSRLVGRHVAVDVDGVVVVVVAVAVAVAVGLH